MKRFMAKVSKSFKGGQKGFTLIELLIVIVILGVLAAAIIPNLSKFFGTGNVGAANAELAGVRTAIAGYMADYDGVAPTDGDAAADNATLAPYLGFSGGIKGDYAWDSDGMITGAAVGSWTLIQWNGTTMKWEEIP